MERTRQAKWDSANMHTVSTKMAAAEFERFKEACAAEQVTAYTLIQRLLRDWMAQRKAPAVSLSDLMGGGAYQDFPLLKKQ